MVFSRISIAAALATAALSLPTSAYAREDAQAWLLVLAQGPVAADVVYFFEVQPRFGNDVSQLSQLLIRPAIGVKLSEKVSVYHGYANVRTPATGRSDTRENRAFQQVNLSLGKPAGVALSSRTRFEQRWLSTGDDVGFRLREMVRAALPVSRDGKVALLASVEVFVALNDTDWGAHSGLDRVRSFAGVQLPLSGKSTVELGYLNQYVKTAARRDSVDHVAAVNLMLRH